MSTQAQQLGLTSIVIPCYNHGRYLADAVRSALAQQRAEVEVIVVDDGSTDNTPEVIATFGDRIRSIRQENQGLSAARNSGLRFAQGEFIVFLDSDDVYDSNFVATLVALLDNREAQAAYCGYRVLDENLQPLGLGDRRIVDPEYLRQTLLDGNFLAVNTVLARRSCYQAAGGFDTDLRALEDWDMWLRLADRYSIVGTPHLLAGKRFLRGSMSGDLELMLRSRLSVLEKHVGAEPTEPLDDASILARCYGRAYLSSCVEFLRQRKDDRAADCYLQLARIAPQLLLEIDTHYAIGCALGRMGEKDESEDSELHHGRDAVIGLLDRTLGDAALRSQISQFRRAAYSQAYRALARLAYNADRFDLARSCLQKAHAGAGAGARLEIALTYLKSLIGLRALGWARSVRRVVTRRGKAWSADEIVTLPAWGNKR